MIRRAANECASVTTTAALLLLLSSEEISPLVPPNMGLSVPEECVGGLVVGRGGSGVPVRGCAV